MAASECRGALMTAPVSRQPGQRGRIQTLDAFRALAIAAVLLFHFTYRFGPVYAHMNLYGYRHNVDWFSAGWLGVDYFFMVSGFVILMTAERCTSRREFFVRRMSRLYPTYLLGMTITFVLCTYLGVPRFYRTWGEFLTGFTMASPFFHTEWVDGAYWSLLVELKFYFYIVILYFSIAEHFAELWAALCSLAIVLSFFPHSGAEAVLSISALPFFSAGMAFYRLYKFRRFTKDVLIFAGAGVASYFATWCHNPWYVHALIAVMVLSFAALVWGKLDWLATPPLVFLGGISYPLYLIHENVGVALIVRMNGISALNGWPSVLIAASAVVVMASVIHYTFEESSQKVCRRILSKWLGVHPRPSTANAS